MYRVVRASTVQPVNLRRPLMQKAQGLPSRQTETGVGGEERGQVAGVVCGERGAAQAARRSAEGAWFITPHAVRRYQQRVERVPYAVALNRLIGESTRAHRVRETRGGNELWRGPKPRRLRFIVGAAGACGLPQLITVMSTFDRKTMDTKVDDGPKGGGGDDGDGGGR